MSYYSRTPENPAGIRLDARSASPARIREIQVERDERWLFSDVTPICSDAPAVPQGVGHSSGRRSRLKARRSPHGQIFVPFPIRYEDRSRQEIIASPRPDGVVVGRVQLRPSVTRGVSLRFSGARHRLSGSIR